MAEYIKREDVLTAITYNGLADPKESLMALTLAVAQKNVRKIPAADVVEVKHARWENVGDSEEDLCFRCTNCKEEFSCEVDFRSYVKYCPECGAKMDGERREV